MNMDNTDLSAAVSGVGNETFGEQWNMSLVEQLTSLEGRLNRLRFLSLQIIVFVISIIYGIIIAIPLIFLPVSFTIFNILLTIASLPIIYVNYAVLVKRLQDTGRGEGWITYAQVVVALSIIYQLSIETDLENILCGLYVLPALPLYGLSFFDRGDQGSNRFGPDPLG